MTPARTGLANAASWSFVMEGGRQLLNLCIAFVLAAMLGPEPYGLVAIAMVFIMFIDLIQRQGMAAALIQHKELTEQHKDTAFWLLMAVSTALLVVAVAGAGWWAGVNDVPELKMVIVGLSPAIPLHGLSLVQDALLRRDLEFKTLAVRSLSAVVSGGVAGIAAALAGWGVWALVVQQVTQALVAAVVLWSVSSWRPGIDIDRRAARDLLSFSTGSFLGSLATFANNQADALLIGLFFGPYVVGIYRLGLRLVETLVSAVLRPVQAIALPELSPHQDDLAEISRRAVRLMRLGAVVALPALGLLAGIAAPAVELLGGEWSAAAPVVSVLCIVGAARVFVFVDGPLLQAKGRPFLQAAFTAVAAVISVASFVAAGLLLQDVAPADQALGIAIARAVVWGLGIMALHTIILRRHAQFDLRRMILPFAWPTAVGAVGGGSAAAAIALLGAHSALLQVVIGGVVGGLTVVVVGLLTMPDAKEMVLRQARALVVTSRKVV